MDKKGVVQKTLAFVITALVMGMLLIAGPAWAFSISLDPVSTNVNLGEEVSLIYNFDIDTEERIPIDYLQLDIFANTNILCRFNSNGSVITGCSGISISKLTDSNYTEGNLTGNYSSTPYNWGYGYGFGYGYGSLGSELLSYNITLNSSLLGYGIHKSNITAKIKSDFFYETGSNITIVKPISITSLNNASLCLVENKNFEIKSEINGTMQSVVLSLNTNGTWQNISLSNIGEGIYSYIVNNASISPSSTIYWQWIVTDIINNVVFGPIESHYFNAKTTLSVSPISPDGLSGWYVTEPAFTLSNPDATNLFYQWDSDDIYNYSSPFGLEDIPNPPVVSAGILDLHFWSDLCSGEESQEEIFHIDLQNPEIIPIVPINGSVLTETSELEQFSIRIDELYQSNSGVNSSSIKLWLNASDITSDVSKAQDGLDVILKYNSSLTNGDHTLKVYAMDNAGRSSELEWPFSVNLVPEVFNMTLTEPNLSLTDSRRVKVNLSISETSLLEYINNNDPSPRFRTLCRNCVEYGSLRKKYLNLREGENNLTIRATSLKGEVDSLSLSIFVDTKKPRIISTYPRTGFVSETFEVEFQEENPVSLVLYYGNSETGFNQTSLELSSCILSRNRYSCSVSVDLEEYDSEEITYNFSLTDIVGSSVSSRQRTLDVDTTSPLINSFNYTISRKSLTFKFNITELNFDNVFYVDAYDSNQRERNLCTSLRSGLCERRQSFMTGSHNLTITARDDAGNLGIPISLNFSCDKYSCAI